MSDDVSTAFNRGPVKAGLESTLRYLAAKPGARSPRVEGY